MPDHGDSISFVIAAHGCVHRFNTERSCDFVLDNIDTIGLITVVSY